MRSRRRGNGLGASVVVIQRSCGRLRFGRWVATQRSRWRGNGVGASVVHRRGVYVAARVFVVHHWFERRGAVHRGSGRQSGVYDK